MACGGGEVIDALGRYLGASGGHKRRWICREHTCETVTFLERSDSVRTYHTQGNPVHAQTRILGSSAAPSW